MGGGDGVARVLSVWLWIALCVRVWWRWGLKLVIWGIALRVSTRLDCSGIWMFRVVSLPG